MTFKINWKSESNCGKVYEAELLNRCKSYSGSGHLIEDEMKVRYEDGREAFVEMRKVEILQATIEELKLLAHPVVRQVEERR